ncbi:HIPL1 protein-like isoform X2 [Lotus japonicus]|uniref:HIPL1 protein-like isoform X2 n=1 Tax=Lotus japonicus TaxID=34305 RepID=UPI00258E27EB|nr:HIPL1 protein-like isoform X2 [Lotus japonicus]
MKSALFISFLFSCSLLLLDSSTSLPLCTDSRAPFTVNTTLEFCPYNGSTCCNFTEDAQIQKQFQLMKVSDPGCASLLKSILCANFCSEVWDTCQTVSITNSPFSPSLQSQGGGIQLNTSATKLTDLWQSKTDFCNAFGGGSNNESLCFEGEPVALNNTETSPISSPHGLCIEKIGSGSYINMVAHPDGSNRAFFSNQMGKVWLATIPDMGSGEKLKLDESSPFVDLTDHVYFDTQFGMMGMAFHPNFANNGRFFASFNCDKDKWSGCNGRCSCNSDVNCDPSKLGDGNGAQPCQYQTVVAEYTANGTASQPSAVESAKPTEVRRIFTMGLPFTSQHGGQILFGPGDGYLYFMMGYGGGSGDPFNFAQNKKSLLGKIMRLDVDNIPSASEITKLGLWGSYSIPKDNPFREDKNVQPEIWALGLRNPWRCSFDSERPSYFFCGDVGQDLYEEVDLITKSGNYGWRVYEGPYLSTLTESSAGNTSLNSINPIPPILGYNHSEVNKNEGSASITGGYVYRSRTDPCMYGRYLYADLYAGAMWAAIEDPENSGDFSTSRIPFSCPHDSPIQCGSVPGSSLPALGYIFSFGEDNSKDVYILASTGVYRVVPPSRCNYACSQEKATTTPSSSHASHWSNFYGYLFLQISSFLLLLMGFM